jgi:hypothetical protein
VSRKNAVGFPDANSDAVRIESTRVQHPAQSQCRRKTLRTKNTVPRRAFDGQREPGVCQAFVG